MCFLVENCFHWVGFHIINYLLENGERVYGVDDTSTEKKEHLSMYVGRNDLFEHLYKRQEDINYNTLIKVEDNQIIITNQDDRSLTINLPLLFGEWMPMRSDGIYYQSNFISFDTDYFKNNAVYVEDFIKSVIQWIDSTQLPAILDVKSINDRRDEGDKLEKSVYIRNNVAIDKNVKTVINHYNNFNEFY